MVGWAIATSPDPTGPWRYPLGQRLLYLHVPLAWAGYAGFLAAAVAAILVLQGTTPTAVPAMTALIETTAIFATASLATGLAWSYEFPGFSPLADPKVLTTAVLVASLAGLWLFSASTPAHRRGDLVATLTLVGTLTVPASYLASRLATPHPDFTRPESSLSPEMTVPLFVATIGITLLLIGLTAVRTRMLSLEARTRW